MPSNVKLKVSRMQRGVYKRNAALGAEMLWCPSCKRKGALSARVERVASPSFRQCRYCKKFFDDDMKSKEARKAQYKNWMSEGGLRPGQKMTPEQRAKAIEKALIELADYIYETNDPGDYFCARDDVYLQRIARRVNMALAGRG